MLLHISTGVKVFAPASLENQAEGRRVERGMDRKLGELSKNH